MKREIHAPTGTELTCKNWLIEAAYRMIQNNLDPDIAFDPDNLIVYGGRGKAARNWESFDAISESLAYASRRLEPIDGEGRFNVIVPNGISEPRRK